MNEFWKYNSSRQLDGGIWESLCQGIKLRNVNRSWFVYATHARLLSNPSIKVFCQIHYDRKYVLAYLERKIIRALMPLEKESFFNLMESAWKYYERNNNLESFLDLEKLENWTVTKTDTLEEIKETESE